MNTRTISKIAVYALAAYAIINLIFLVANFMQYNLLSDYANGAISDDAYMPLATANDSRMFVIAMLFLASLFVCLFVVGRWIYVACKMNHRANIQGLHYTPGWSVGWLFVPIANLFKPPMAMAEIYRASFAASDPIWANRSLPFVFTTWWGSWIISNILGNISFRLSLDNGGFGGDFVSNLITSTQLDMGANVLDIICSLSLISIIRTVAKNQESLETMLDSSVFD